MSYLTNAVLQFKTYTQAASNIKEIQSTLSSPEVDQRIKNTTKIRFCRVSILIIFRGATLASWFFHFVCF